MKQKYPLLIALPHCSNLVPKKVESNLNLSKQEVEHYLDIGSAELYDLETFHVFSAEYSRLYCDLNRAPDHKTSSQDRGGVIPKTTYWRKKIYKKPLNAKEEEQRIAEHDGYFNALEQYIQKHQIQFLISGHTMDHLLLPEEKKSSKRADICLSNNGFVTCDAIKTHQLKHRLEEEGYTVSINRPFTGGYLLNSLCHRNVLPGLQMEFSFKLVNKPKTQQLNSKKTQEHKSKIQSALLKFWKEDLLNE